MNLLFPSDYKIDASMAGRDEIILAITIEGFDKMISIHYREAFSASFYISFQLYFIYTISDYDRWMKL